MELLYNIYQHHNICSHFNELFIWLLNFWLSLRSQRACVAVVSRRKMKQIVFFRIMYVDESRTTTPGMFIIKVHRVHDDVMFKKRLWDLIKHTLYYTGWNIYKNKAQNKKSRLGLCRLASLEKYPDNSSDIDLPHDFIIYCYGSCVFALIDSAVQSPRGGRHLEATSSDGKCHLLSWELSRVLFLS